MNQRLKEIRERLGKTLREVEQDTGIDDSLYSCMEKGTRRIKDRTIRVLNAIYGISESWLRFGEGEMFEKVEEISDRKRAERYLAAKRDELPDELRSEVLGFIRRLLEKSEVKHSESEKKSDAPEVENLRKIG